jgi:SPP1 family predicted phage head-tail adaptor
VWVDHLTTKAYVKPTSGNERFFAMRTEANITHRIYIRYRAGILPNMRVNYDGRLMEIKSVIDIDERKKWLEIGAVEGQAT